MDSEAIIAALKRLDIPDQEIADVIGRDRTAATKMLGGKRNVQAREIGPLMELIAKYEGGPTEGAAPQPRDYLPVEILPTYAGMGGGGNGDADRETALVPRALIVDILRGKPEDFLLINVRGDSMEPDFRHDDQLLVDRRDISPAQPGPFAIWDGEWGEYVVKNVERLTNGEVRVFSSNPKYSPSTVRSEETRIIGRPVWFGRRL